MIRRLWRSMSSWMIGDCSRPGRGHSIMYHVAFIGCIKPDCRCEEFQ